MKNCKRRLNKRGFTDIFENRECKRKNFKHSNLASVEYNLPAFILQGILGEILAETRTQAQIETLNDVNLILNEKKEE